MAKTFDLNLMPLVRLMGHDRTELSGLFVAEPPRRVSRQRRGDRLILYLAQQGNAPVPRSHVDALLEKLAAGYYRSGGSVTAGLRSLAEDLNAMLRERNMRSAGSNQQVVGWLTQILLREDSLYLAQSGPTQIFRLHSAGVETLHSPELAGNGLGVSRATAVRYAQAQLEPNDTFLVAVKPAPNWSPGALQGLHGQGPEGQRRRLLGQAGPEVEALLIQARPGKGEITVLKGLPTGAAAPPEVPAAPAVQDLQAPVPVPIPVAPEDQPAGAEEPTLEDISAAPVELPEVVMEATAAPVEAPTAPAQAIQPDHADSPQAAAPKPARRPSQVRQAGSAVLGALMGMITISATVIDWLFNLVRAVMKRVLPDEGFFTISSSIMALVALAVPVVVVSVSSVVYFQLGRNAQYHTLLNQAESAAQQADAAADLTTQRSQYQAALQYLQQAIKIGDTPEASNLLLRVQQSLDQIDNIRRAEYRSALLEPLPDDVVISRLLIEDSFLYMLDQTSGAVLRAVSTGDGYLLDRTFQCGPQFQGGFGAGPLIDITLVAEGDPEAVLLGIDASGRVMRCYLSKPPEVETIAVPAQMQSSALRGITEADGVFYVLDPPNSEVWFYWNGNFGDVQQFFVGVAPPVEMTTMVDLAVERFNLYLLNQSGAVTLCSLSTLDVAPTRCSENLPFTDGRSGGDGRPLSFEQPFTQVMVSPPPDPSLFLLQAETQGIFQFSLNNLVYQRQYMPFLPLGEGGATAFYVDRLHQQLYLAVGGEVYFTTMP